ncbi:MAG TPA: AMP-binding protein [Opitutaceae bacterium]|jgi:acyl-CoA synthetase (AMP-forming)/AMP-acid ligase II|nr:AMP-binding protein [Opitutaceae bacterium]
MADRANIAQHFALMAARAPQQCALKIPRGRTRSGDIDYLAFSFAELAAETTAWQTRLADRGVCTGDRALVMVRPGLPLIASVFALFALGAVPVVIDPGMSRKNFLACVARSRPRVLVGIPLAQVLSHIFRGSFRSVAVRVPVSGSLTARIASGAQSSGANFQIADSRASDLAAVLFTSGSTGAPKGVCYEHGMFEAQLRLLRDTYGIEPGEVDLPLLPVFALFNPALGLTTIVPEVDPRRPAAADPAKIVQAIRQENVTNSFGSPTLWRKIAGHCLAQKITLPSLRRVLCAGAPVPADLWQNSRVWLPNGRLHSPYGATEALPVSSVSSDEILSLLTKPTISDFRFQIPDAEWGKTAKNPSEILNLKSEIARPTHAFLGACVGRALAGIEIKIIALTDGPIASLADARELPLGEIGEIIVRGPVVTKLYDALPEPTALAKISDSQLSALDSQLAASGGVWHRMGDCGYLDAAGRLWFCGRKAERVETAAGPLYTEPCEQVFRTHPRVTRCALIGLGPRGAQRPALVVEGNIADPQALARELRALALAHPHTAAITAFYFHPAFPVDVRHNAKIHRLTLATWATTAKGYEGETKQ